MALILEWGAEDGFAARSCPSGITRLCHETLDDAVEDAAIVVTLHTELHKVSAGDGCLLAPKLHIERTEGRV